MAAAGKRVIVDHLQWLVERDERINEGFLQRSSTFIGFLAVELSLVGQASSDSIHLSELPTRHWPVPLLFLLTVLCLLGALVSFLISLLTQNIDSDDFSSDLRKAVDDSETIAFDTVIKSLLGRHNGDPNHFTSLAAENKLRSTGYLVGVYFAFMAQAFLAVMVIIK